MFAAHAPWWSYFTSSCSDTCSSGEVHRGVELLGIAKASSAPADESSHAWQRLQLGTPCHLQWYSSHVLRQRQWRNNASASEAEYISPASAVIGASAPEVEYVALASAVRSNHAMCTPRHCLPRSWRRPQPGAQRQRQRRSPAPAVTATPAPVAVYITVPTCAQRQHQWRRHRAETSDVAASHSQTAVAAAGTLRRHIPRLLLRQQGRCGVTLSDCCCGSSGRCGVTFAHCCCGSGFRSAVVSTNPHLFQRGGCLRRVIALHIGVDRITRLCHALIILGRLISGEARNGGFRVARSGRQVAWQLGLSS